MSATFISYQWAGDQRKNDDQNDALFAFRKNKNPDHAFHFFA
jgi:hypothetical protein